MNDNQCLWGGRFTETPDAALLAFGASLAVDRRMWREDIAGSIAHAQMLAATGVLSASDVEDITAGLNRIAELFEADRFEFAETDEDIHTAIERALVADIGVAGQRLHTGRSRNDQVATDTRLYIKARSQQLLEQLHTLCEVLLNVAEANIEAVMPGYTHLQKAQPVLFAHHLLVYFWMFQRDRMRMQAARSAANASPLGAAALAGTGYPLDRAMTADRLGFTDEADRPVVIPNSMDAVSDRDYLLDTLYAASTTMMHLSRLCEELILWSTDEFGFITLSDAYSTGSSIMPQKKNPDFAELIRGKTGRVYGSLMGLLTVLKGLPLTYNKDMQEDKEATFDALDTLQNCLSAAGGMLMTMTVNSDRMLAGANRGFMAATDLADWLVRQGVPFRQAHEIVGSLVLLAERRGVGLDGLTLPELQAVSELLTDEALAVLDIKTVVAARTTYGGTAPERVREQIALARLELDKSEKPDVE